MRALLLAAGIGSRLRPITDTVPKCLVPIHGKPLLGYWLELLLNGTMERVLINTHYLPDQVRQFVAASPFKDRIDLVNETELLGTGGTAFANEAFFGNAPFLVAHADNLTTFNVDAFVKRHEAKPAYCAITMLAFRTDDPRSCGILEVDGSDVVQAFHEKVETPPGNLANAAVYIFEPEVLDYMNTLNKNVIDLSTEVIPHYLGRICVMENDGYHRDIGNIESLRRAHEEFPKR
ncbi:MAG: nucleotidyltransferase family protein [Parvibaculaceae bacterium]